MHNRPRQIAFYLPNCLVLEQQFNVSQLNWPRILNAHASGLAMDDKRKAERRGGTLLAKEEGSRDILT